MVCVNPAIFDNLQLLQNIHTIFKVTDFAWEYRL